MDITNKEVTISELFDQYQDDEEEGVFGYSGKLNIRPAYQREFVYREKERDAVIDTVLKGFPLNTMYWVKNNDGTYELLDGQQRTISICRYCANDFSINQKTFANQPDDIKEKILNYKLHIYVCEGTASERIEWFNTINIAGVKLEEQEILNANYTGTWLTDAKKRFSKTGCPAYNLANKYLSGSCIRQDYLETALKWINDDNPAGYMSDHQNDANAVELWNYFSSVIEWVKATIPNYRKDMQGINWGELYNKYHSNQYDVNVLESEISRLYLDRDVTNKKGIFHYVFSKDEKKLNIRAFDDIDKKAKYEEQQGICPKCNKHFAYEEMDGDHILPWSRGGKTEYDNLQMLCIKCNRSNT